MFMYLMQKGQRYPPFIRLVFAFPRTLPKFVVDPELLCLRRFYWSMFWFDEVERGNFSTGVLMT